MGKEHGAKKKETSATESASRGPCTAQGCKRGSDRFEFCAEHYDHFKFGLIKKDGKPVSDYERKFEHYQDYLAKQKSARRVA